MNIKEATDAIETITSRMGGGEFTPEQVAEALANSHRTLQQNVMDFALIFIEKMASKYEHLNFDHRNEAAVKAAVKIRNYVFEEHSGTFYRPPMPFI